MMKTVKVEKQLFKKTDEIVKVIEDGKPKDMKVKKKSESGKTTIVVSEAFYKKYLSKDVRYKLAGKLSEDDKKVGE